MIELDRILHQPIRTRIVAYLIAHGSTDFVTLKNLLHLSDGHMTTHMSELIENNYVTITKTICDKKSKTTYHLTPAGKAAFSSYVEQLRKIINI